MLVENRCPILDSPLLGPARTSPSYLSYRGARNEAVLTAGDELMDMRDEWLRDLRSWASKNESVRELWLYGSRARGNSREESDIDLAIALMPPIGNHDWAFGNYSALGDAWQRKLETMVGRHVSLELIVPGTEPDVRVRRCGRLVWARG